MIKAGFQKRQRGTRTSEGETAAEELESKRAHILGIHGMRRCWYGVRSEIQGPGRSENYGRVE